MVEVSQSKRDADVYNALDKAKLPAADASASISSLTAKKPFSLNKIRSDVEKMGSTSRRRGSQNHADENLRP